MAINENCTSKQTFCELGYQTVSSINELKFTYNPSLDGIVTADIWNQIINEIIKIYNYGTRGTRNPINPLGINNFKAISDTHNGNEDVDADIVSEEEKQKKQKKIMEIIPMDKYNEILNTIGITPIAGIGTIISKEQFNSIKTTINNYSLNSTRCNNCNVNCNAKCEAASECYCYDDCYDDCYLECYQCGSHAECSPCGSSQCSLG